MRRGIVLTAIAMAFVAAAFYATLAAAQGPNRMSTEEVKSMLGNPSVVIIDVRVAADWKTSTEKVKGAVREDPEEVDIWMSKYPKDRTLIFYCA
jgi:rhodanese-related sulfurtransferase